MEAERTLQAPIADLPPLNRIRVETALSRFPIHRLAKKGNISIDLQRFNDRGEADFKWEVTYNAKYGQPGPLAYKVDTVIVNRRIDELGRPLPEVIKIGSLSDICRALGRRDTGPNIADLKRALLQNASAFINAKIRYRTKSGRERWGEIGYTRYSVIFTGETLPDGQEANGVYIVLNPPYRDLLNHVELRPLDYDYIAQLSPGAQRFYELLSFQIYGAIASGRPRAKLIYSDYCKYAPQTRCGDFEHAKKQMYKIHLPHRESGYIAKIEYEEIVGIEGPRDWEMLYTPGPKALAEYEAFTNRRIRQHPPALPQTRVSDLQHPIQTAFELSDDRASVITELTRRGITEKKARELVGNLKPGQELLDQIEYVDFVIATARPGKFENPPGMYVLYVRDNLMPPANFISSRQRRLQEEANQAKNAKLARRAQLEIAYEEFQRDAVERYIASLPAAEYTQLLAEARRELKRTYANMAAEQLEAVAANWVRAEVKNKGRVPVMSFEEFCRQRLAQ